MTDPTPRRGRGWKKWLAILASVLGVLVLAVLVAPFFIPWDQVRTEVERQGSAALHHRLTIGAVRVHLLQGIEIRDLKLANASDCSAEPLFSDQAVILRYRLLPLLWGQFMVKSLVFRAPHLQIERRPNGTFNFSDMLPNPTTTAPAAKPTAAQPPSQLPLQLLVDRFAIENGQFVFLDLGTKQRFALKALDLSVEGLSLSGLTPSKTRLSTKVQALGRTLPFKADLSWRLNWAKQQFDLEQGSVNLPGVLLTLRGGLNKLFAQPEMAFKGDLELDLGRAQNELLPPALMAQAPKDLVLSGQGSVHFSLTGALAKLGSLEFVLEDQLKAAAKTAGHTIPLSAEGKLVVRAQRVSWKQTMAVSEQPLHLDLGITGFDLEKPESLAPKTTKAKVQVSLESAGIDASPFMALLPPGPAVAVKAQPKPVVATKEPDPRSFVPAGLELNGHIQLGWLKFGQVKLGKIESALLLKQRVFSANSRLQGYGGQIQNPLRLDLSGPQLAYQLKADLKTIQLQSLMNDVVQTFVAAQLKQPKIIAELKDKLSGVASGQLDLAGRGMTPAVAKPQLKGVGHFSLTDTRLRQFSFQQDLSQWLGNERFKQDLAFDRTNLDFLISDQRVQITRFVAESGPDGRAGDLRLSAEGGLSFEAEFQQFKLKAQLNPRAAANLSGDFQKYSEILKDERGWTTLPIILDGPMTKPKVDPDWALIQEQAQGYASRKAQSELQGAGQRELERAKEKLKNVDWQHLFK